jgi:hypothetical protein
MGRHSKRERRIARAAQPRSVAPPARTAALVAAIALSVGGAAQADEPEANDPARARVGSVAPPPLDIPYLQYGVAFTAEFVATAGKMCAGSPQNCILGSGGGVVARVGRRSAGPWYFGAAYELSKQDSSGLYPLATLQQARAEARWYFNTGRETYPYLTAGAGVAAYGNEWVIDTYGPAAFVGVGLESQISREVVVGFAFSYRVIGLRSFFDSAGSERDASVVQIIGIDLSLEERNPITRPRR